jgi:hypothetical protein
MQKKKRTKTQMNELLFTVKEAHTAYARSKKLKMPPKFAFRLRNGRTWFNHIRRSRKQEITEYYLCIRSDKAIEKEKLVHADDVVTVQISIAQKSPE